MSINFMPLMFRKVIVLLLAYLTVGCAGVNTFNQYAKSGETVAIAVGHQPNWSRDSISVWVRPLGGDWTQYPADDPRIRAVVNFYADPLSSIVLSNRTSQQITQSSLTYAGQLTNNFTAGSRDWFQTTVFFDLPDTMALGAAEILVEEVADPNNFKNATVEIVGAGGIPHEFQAELLGSLDRGYLGSLERASHYVVNLSGTGAIPHAVQLEFTHDPDVDNAGSGRAYVVEPISGVKNISWTDDGTNLRVVIIPADGKTLSNFKDFKFYIAGGILNVAPSSTQAFDISGAPVTGVTAVTTPHNIVIDTTVL